mgnify:CR=1 FL=1
MLGTILVEYGPDRKVQLAAVARVWLGRQVFATAEFPNASFAKRMVLHGLTLRLGDVVLYDEEVGRILACAQERTTMMIIVERGTMMRHISSSSSIWEFTGESSVWAPTVVSVATAWYHFEDNDNCIVVLA